MAVASDLNQGHYRKIQAAGPILWTKVKNRGRSGCADGVIGHDVDGDGVKTLVHVYLVASVERFAEKGNEEARLFMHHFAGARFFARRRSSDHRSETVELVAQCRD